MSEKPSAYTLALGRKLDAFAAAISEGPEAATCSVADVPDLLTGGLGLSDHEHELLFWALAGVYREAVAAAFGRWSGSPSPSVLTRSALSKLAQMPLEQCEALWSSALQRQGRLLRLGLIQLEGDAILPSAALRMQLTGCESWPEDLQDCAQLWMRSGRVSTPVLPAVAAQRFKTLCHGWAVPEPAPLTYLIGATGTGRTLCARHLAAARDKALLSVEATLWPERRDILTLARESHWRNASILLKFESHHLGDGWRKRLQGLLEEGIDVLVALPKGGVPESFSERAVAWLGLGVSQQAERRALWSQYLPAQRRAPGLTDEVLAFRFRGAPATIASLASQALDLSQLEGETVSLEHLQEVARCTMSPKLAEMATLEAPLAQGLAEVVLPPTDLAQLREVLFRVRHRQKVVEQWGFGGRIRSGLGTVALFSGPPGTGKTLSARAVASELGVTLYRIDLSRIVSKWVGETEKHLGALFAEAEASGAALLFDEADALFAKRTEVKSSNDKYANLEVGYLLQRIEEFTGLCFLTTNMDRSIDDAFMRRLAVHLRFSMPAQDERAAIWRSLIPPNAPLAADVAVDALAARFEIGGGTIRNAALRAAYRAAEAGQPICHADLVWAAEFESATSGILTRQSSR